MKTIGNRTKEKDNKRFSVGVVLLTVVVAATLFLSACGGGVNGTVYKIPAAVLPTEDVYALQQYDYENLSDVQPTIRSDSLNVTARNLPRTTPQMLSNDFSLVYDGNNNTLYPVYGTAEGGNGLSVATIRFADNNWPDPMHGKSSGTEAYAAAAAEAGVTEEEYFAYYKYMYMTQGQHLALEAARRSAETASDSDEVNANFAAWLKKHPSADLQYGAVLGSDNAVRKEIKLDPLYRSPHTTGLYLPAGEPITVKVEGLKAGEYITVDLGLQNSLAWRGSVSGGWNNADITALTGGNVSAVKFANNASDAFFKQADLVTASGNFFTYNKGGSTPFLQSQWARQNGRAPWLTASFRLSANKTYTLGTAFGGVIHIGMGNCYSSVKTTITGAVETPHYILGVTTPEYFDQYLRQAPGVIAVLDTENGELIGPTGEMGTTSYMRQVKTDEIDKLAMLWHSFITVDESFTGGVYNRFNKVMFDWHVPAGAAVALGGYSFAHPTGWFDGAMNYRGLLASGTWGPLHEIGHNHASAYGTVWGFGSGQESEVRNNALTVLAYILLCDVGTTIRNGGGAEHGMYANPYSTLSETIANKEKFADFGNTGYFQALGMYANIMHSFSAQKYYELLYTYKGMPSYCSNKRADFAYRCSLVYQMNFLKYFNTFYGANITDDMFTEGQLAEMQALPNYEPISNFYAGGIDGVKTGGDYIVAFGDDIVFDLTGTTICTLDTADSKGFEVLSVSQPEHGKIKATADGKWAYSFNKKYTGTFDEFSFDVRLSDGIIHTLTITLRIEYNGARVSTYTGIENPGVTGEKMIDALETQIASLTPTYSNSTVAGVPSYTAKDEWQVRVGDFWWKAPQSGEVTLAISGTNGLCLYFGEDFENLQRTNLIYSGGAHCNHPYTVTVEEGKYYAVRVLNTNRGASGSALVGILGENGKYAAIPASQIYHPLFPRGEEVPAYIYEPKFLVSKKDSIKLAVTGTDKSEWTIVKAPENIVGGRYDEQQLIDPETGEPLEGEDNVLRVDKWSWLIDGLSGTYLHTTYGSGDKVITPENPHEFIVDTQNVQFFNYFAVTTRNHKNAYIMDCELQISDTPNGEWETVATATREDYVNNTITMKFPQVEGRYLKLIVKGTSGNSGNGGANFSALAELDAGIQSTTQQVLPSTSQKYYATKGWVNSSTIDSEPNGYLISQKKNQKLVIRFRGEGISLYAATGKGFGSAKIVVDGKTAGTIDLDSETEEARKLVFNRENMSNKEHTVEIITTSAKKVMMNVVGLPYSATLVNAPNIYKERALTISLVVFVLLFAATLAFVLVCAFVPKFRQFIFRNGEKSGEKKRKEKAPKKEKEQKKEKATVIEKPAEKKPTENTVAAKPAAQPSAKTTATPASRTTTATAARPTTTATKPAATPTRPAAPTRPAPATRPATGTANRTVRPAAKPSDKRDTTKK